MLRDLRHSGVVHVSSVLKEEEVEEALRLFWLEYPSLPHMAHSRLLWYLRCLPSVQRPFRRVYGEETPLIASFDGASLSSPSSPFEIGWHVDQDATRPPGMACLQGVLSLSSCEACLQVEGGSHKKHASRMLKYGLPSSKGGWEFEEVGDEEVDEGSVFSPSLSAGDMLLFDSRCAHRVVPPTSGTRIVAYLSFLPRSSASPSVLRRRREAFEKGISTTHWADRCVDRGDDRRRTAPEPEEVLSLV